MPSGTERGSSADLGAWPDEDARLPETGAGSPLSAPAGLPPGLERQQRLRKGVKGGSGATLAPPGKGKKIRGKGRTPQLPGRSREPEPEARSAPKRSARRPGSVVGRPGSRQRSFALSGDQGERARGLVRSVARLPRWALAVTGSAVVAVLAIVGYLLLASPSVHVVSVPDKLGGYVKDPALANATHAQQLRNGIVAGAAGEVRNVVGAVYEKSTGPGTSTGPQIIVFIGGNLTGGGSAGGFISGFTAQLHRSFTTGVGVLGGQAACAPGSNGGPAECAWADGDTFGVIISPTLSAAGLASEMRQMRPLVEHAAK